MLSVLSVILQVLLVQKVLKEILVHLDILDSKEQMGQKEKRG